MLIWVSIDNIESTQAPRFLTQDRQLQPPIITLTVTVTVGLPKQRQVKVDWYLFVLEVPLCILLTSMCDFVPRDRIVQRMSLAKMASNALVTINFLSVYLCAQVNYYLHFVMITCCEIDNNNEIFCAGVQIRPTKNMSMREKTGQGMIHPKSPILLKIGTNIWFGK